MKAILRRRIRHCKYEPGYEFTAVEAKHFDFNAGRVLVEDAEGNHLLLPERFLDTWGCSLLENAGCRIAGNAESGPASSTPELEVQNVGTDSDNRPENGHTQHKGAAKH